MRVSTVVKPELQSFPEASSDEEPVSYGPILEKKPLLKSFVTGFEFALGPPRFQNLFENI